MFVLLLHSYIDLSLSITIFLKGADSNRNVIYTGKTVEKHTDVVPSLLADHTLSECDSMPELYGLGKKSVCSLLLKSPLQHLVETSPDISDVIQEGKTFIAANYGWHHQHNRYFRNQVFINTSRHIIILCCIWLDHKASCNQKEWYQYNSRTFTATMRSNQKQTMWKLFEIHELMTTKEFLPATNNHTYTC